MGPLRTLTAMLAAIAVWTVPKRRHNLRHRATVAIRGSIVGTRFDLQEALDFAGAGKVKATTATEPLENMNQVFARMRAGDIEGRIGIDFQK